MNATSNTPNVPSNAVSNVIFSLTAIFAGMVLLILGNTLLLITIPLEMEAASYSASVSGAIMSAYFLGFAGGAYYGQYLILQVGHIRTFACFATIFSATVVAHPLFVDPVAWGLFRLSSGICTAGIFLVIESWLNERAPFEIRGKVLAVYTTLTYAAQLLGLQLIKLFDIGAVKPYLFATLLLSFSLVPVVLTKITAPNFSETKPLSLRTLTKFSPLAVVGTAVSGIMMGSFYSLAAIFISRLGYSNADATNFTSGMVIGGLLFLFPVGWLTDRFDRRLVLLLILIVSAVACFLTAIQNTVLPGIVGLIALAVVIGSSISSIYPIAITQAYDYLEPDQYVAAATGLFVAFAIGSFGGPFITGFLMQYTVPEALFFMMSLTSLSLAAFTFYRMRAREALPMEEQEQVFVTTAIVSELDPRAEPELEEEKEIWETMREEAIIARVEAFGDQEEPEPETEPEPEAEQEGDTEDQSETQKPKDED
ncbi:MAG: MFS transporter [Alphaproteobacteria bacterium]